MLIHFVTPETNLQSFLNQLDPTKHHTIHLSKGVYRQKLKLSLSNITFLGSSMEDTTIVYNDYSYKLHEDGLLYNTFRTSTLTITGSNNTFKNITIQNDAGYGPLIGQAIALAIYGNNNKFSYCQLIGNQDTLFIGPLPVDLTKRYAHILPLDERHTTSTLSIFNDCRITGNIDFIFGSGDAVFKSCELIFNESGYLAAPSTLIDGVGLVFYNCKVTSLHPNYQIALARPWREYGKTTFIDTQFVNLNIVNRYDAWAKTHFEFREHPYIFHPLNQMIDREFKSKINKIIST